MLGLKIRSVLRKMCQFHLNMNIEGRIWRHAVRHHLMCSLLWGSLSEVRLKQICIPLVIIGQYITKYVFVMSVKFVYWWVGSDAGFIDCNLQWSALIMVINKSILYSVCVQRGVGEYQLKTEACDHEHRSLSTTSVGSKVWARMARILARLKLLLFLKCRHVFLHRRFRCV